MMVVEVVEQSKLDRRGMTDWEVLHNLVGFHIAYLSFLLHAFMTMTLLSSGKMHLFIQSHLHSVSQQHKHIVGGSR